MKLKYVVDRCRKQSQPRLKMRHPLACFRELRCGVCEQASEQLHARQRIANFVRKDRGDFGECMGATCRLSFFGKPLLITYIANDPDGLRLIAR